MNLLILERLADEYRERLAPEFPELNIQTAKDEEEAGPFIGQADILLAIRVSDDLLKKAVNLKWIQCLIAGVDYIADHPSFRKEILLTSTKGIHGPQMSEIAFLMMLALNRNLPQVIKNQEREVWERWPGRLLYQKKVGIFGLGTSGLEIARKCKAFGMTVYGVGTTNRGYADVDFFFPIEDTHKMAGEVDYFLVVAPNTPRTRGLIDRRMLSLMKPSAFFINIGRGEIVDEAALMEFLNEGRIAGAALDTFCQEPLPPGHPLWKTKNLIITPHVGGMSDIYVDQALAVFRENLSRYLRGERKDLINVVTL